MSTEQIEIPFNYATLLDLHYWTVEQGCFFLVAYKRGFKECEIKYLYKELSKHGRKKPESAFSFMKALAFEIESGKTVIPDAGAFIEFIRIYKISASAFNIEELVTPYKFISWAISKRTIIVHDDLIKWREEERYRSPTGRTSAMREALKNAQSRITELETALAADDAEMAALRQENAALQAELEKVRHGQEPADLEEHGLCGRVIMWRREGKTEEEIAAILSDAGTWCSAAQIGALLYLKEGRVSKDTMQKHGQRLLGTA